MARLIIGFSKEELETEINRDTEKLSLEEKSKENFKRLSHFAQTQYQLANEMRKKGYEVSFGDRYMGIALSIKFNSIEDKKTEKEITADLQSCVENRINF